jgi:hypothetical protein
VKGIGFSKIIVILIGQGTSPTDVPPPVDFTTAVSMGLFMALFFRYTKGQDYLMEDTSLCLPLNEDIHIA